MAVDGFFNKICSLKHLFKIEKIYTAFVALGTKAISSGDSRMKKVGGALRGQGKK